MTVGEQLDEYVGKALWRDLSALLDGLDDDALPEALAWYRKGRGVANRLAVGGQLSRGEAECEATCAQLLAIHFAPSAAKAASWFGWATFAHFEQAAEPLVLRSLASWGREWCAEFVQAAGDVAAPRGAHQLGRMVQLVMPLLAHFGLPMPTGPTYARAWAQYYTSMKFRWRWGRPPEEGQYWIGESVLRRPASLLEAFRSDPVLADGLSAAMATGELGDFVILPVEGWEIDEALAALVQEKRLDPERVTADCLAALTRQNTATVQRAMARILAAMGVSAAHLAGQVPLLQGLMATSHGSVTAVLLEPLIDALCTPDELAELALTIFARKEKKQKAVLLKALLAKDAVDRFGIEAVKSALARAAQVDDAAVSGRAAKALAALGLETPTVDQSRLEGLWGDLVEATVAGPFEPFTPGPEGFTRALSDQSWWDEPTDVARFLDALVRWAKADLPAAKSWFRSVEAEREYVGQAVDWATGRLTGELVAEQEEAAARYHSGAPDGWNQEYTGLMGGRPAISAFSYLHVQEILLRAGEIPYLLSTPTYCNGVLAFDDLVERIRGYGSIPCGSLDLFQSLLRLEPVAPERVAELPADGEGVLAIIRQWVAGGGLPAFRARLEDGRFRAEKPTLPVDPAVFGGMAAALLTGRELVKPYEYLSYMMTEATTVGVIPNWPDLFAYGLLRDFEQGVRRASQHLHSLVTSAPGTAGRGVHRVLAIGLSYPDEESRLRAVDALLLLIGEGGFDAGLFETELRELVAAGSLPLARTSAALEQVVLAGALKQVWPAILAMADQAAGSVKRPTGLPEVLSFVRRYLAAVPEPVVPPAVRALAASKGSTKAVVEARALVAAAEGVGS